MRQTPINSKDKNVQVVFTLIEPIQSQSIWGASSIIIDGNNITYNMRSTDCGSPPDNSNTVAALTLYRPTKAFANA